MSEFEEELLGEILSSKGFTKGNCLNCGKPYLNLVKKQSQFKNRRNAFCSETCFLEDKKKRGGIKHYEVFKDENYYYLKMDGRFYEKRSHSGKTNYNLKEDIFPTDKTTKILPPSETIPDNAVKIIDKKSQYLYSEKEPFDGWKKLKGRI